MSPTNSSTAEIAPAKTSFRLKGGLFPLTLLELHHYDPVQLQQDLATKVAEAPGFFQQTPVILGLDNFSGNSTELPLDSLRQSLRDNGMLLVALKGAPAELEARAEQAGLAIMAAQSRPSNKTPRESSPEPTPVIQAVEEPTPDIAANTPVHTAIGNKIITTPVRSGQQVYAPGGDLIVLAPVSAGAEILADGNIHVYAPLRGRALAGVQGDESAQVFCQSLEAELISIAGHFKLVEDLKNEHWKQAVRISLQEQTLHTAPLVKR